MQRRRGEADSHPLMHCAGYGNAGRLRSAAATTVIFEPAIQTARRRTPKSRNICDSDSNSLRFALFALDARLEIAEQVQLAAAA
jgi:hypothetical protein